MNRCRDSRYADGVCMTSVIFGIYTVVACLDYEPEYAFVYRLLALVCGAGALLYRCSLRLLAWLAIFVTLAAGMLVPAICGG